MDPLTEGPRVRVVTAGCDFMSNWSGKIPSGMCLYLCSPQIVIFYNYFFAPLFFIITSLPRYM